MCRVIVPLFWWMCQDIVPFYVVSKDGWANCLQSGGSPVFPGLFCCRYGCCSPVLWRLMAAGTSAFLRNLCLDVDNAGRPVASCSGGNDVVTHG